MPLVSSKSSCDFRMNSFGNVRAKSYPCLKNYGRGNSNKKNLFNGKTFMKQNSKRFSKSDSDLSKYKNTSIKNGTVSKSMIFQKPNSALISSTINLYSKLSSTDYVKVPIVGYEVMEEREKFTIYKLRIENSLSRDCWLVLRRYTDFVRLNNKLKLLFPQITLQLPKKKIFGDNFSNEFLDNRKNGLQIFINSIMNNTSLKNHEIVKDFFCLEEPPTYSDNMEECKSIFEAQEETISNLKYELEIRNNTIINLQTKLLFENKEKEKLLQVIEQVSRKCSICFNEINSYFTQ